MPLQSAREQSFCILNFLSSPASGASVPHCRSASRQSHIYLPLLYLAASFPFASSSLSFCAPGLVPSLIFPPLLTHTHTHTHTYLHTRKQIETYRRRHRPQHKQTRAHTHPPTTQTHTHAHTHTHTHRHISIQLHAHTQTHAKGLNTHTSTHTHAHILITPPLPSLYIPPNAKRLRPGDLSG